MLQIFDRDTYIRVYWHDFTGIHTVYTNIRDTYIYLTGINISFRFLLSLIEVMQFHFHNIVLYLTCLTHVDMTYLNMYSISLIEVAKILVSKLICREHDHFA